MSTIHYTKFDLATQNETIGWKSAAGYLEGTIKRIDRLKNTACEKTLSDWVLVDVLPYFARFEGETAYLNANFLMGGGKVRKLSRKFSDLATSHQEVCVEVSSLTFKSCKVRKNINQDPITESLLTSSVLETVNTLDRTFKISSSRFPSDCLILCSKVKFSVVDCAHSGSLRFL